jgi:hypothetical protein
MVSPELRSRARRYGYLGKTKEEMLNDLDTLNEAGTSLALIHEWQRARAKTGQKGDEQ